MLRKPATTDTNRQRPDLEALTLRRMGAAPVLSTIDEATRSIDFVLLTQDAVIDAPPDLQVDEDNPVYVDDIVLLDGVEHDAQIPLVADHLKTDIRALHGSLRSFRIDGDKLIARAFFADDPESDAVWRKVKGGHLTDISGGFRPTQVIDIPPGQSATVRGKVYTARADRATRITVRSRLREGSLVTIGADPRAKARSAPPESTTNRGSTPPKDSTMKFSDWLKAMGLDPAGLSDTHRSALQAEFDALKDTERSDAEVQKTVKGRHEARVALAGDTQRRQTDDRGHQSHGLSQADVERAAVEAGRRAVETERTRVRQIEEICGGEEALAEVCRQAIAEGWDTNRTSAEALKKIRASRTAAVGVPAFVGQPEMSREALGLSLTIRAGNDPMRGVKPSQKAERERIAEQADRMRDMSLFDVCRAAIRLDGKSVPYGREDTIREAVSGGTVSNIFTQSVSATLLRSFDETADSTQGLVVEADVPDFKTNDRIRAGEAGNLTKLGRGGTAEHDTISDGVESYKIARFAKQFQIDEQDIIDDNFGVLVQRPVQLGNAARRLRPDLVYAILVDNPNLADSIALFQAATHKNLQTGGSSALSATSLKAAIAAMAKQTGVRPEVILNLMAKFLVIPVALQWDAKVLLRSGENREGRGSSKTTDQGTYNPLQESNLDIRMDARLDNGFTDPSDGSAVAGSATRWFLFGDPAQCPTIEVGYLRGSNRSPSVRSWVMDRGSWGIGFDVKHDIGAKAIDFRNMQRADGA